MKVGFITSKRAEKEYKKEFETIIKHLQSKGYEVIHHMDMPLEKILPLSYAERQDLFMKFYKALEDCDLVFVETTLQSTQVGFGLAHMRLKGRSVVILTQGDVANQFFPKGDIYSDLENTMAYQYNKSNIIEILEEALEYMAPHLDKRFTIIFPSHLLAKIEEIAQKKKLPKSVYIRQLIEKDLQEQ